MRAYSMDLRTRVLAALDAGDPTAVVADRFAVSRSWVRRLAQRRRENQEVAPRTRAPRASQLREYHPRIRELLTAAPDRTLAELRAELGVTVALSTLWVAVRSLGYTFKKR
jgi:transposase